MAGDGVRFVQRFELLDVVGRQFDVDRGDGVFELRSFDAPMIGATTPGFDSSQASAVCAGFTPRRAAVSALRCTMSKSDSRRYSILVNSSEFARVVVLTFPCRARDSRAPAGSTESIPLSGRRTAGSFRALPRDR